MAHTQVQWGRGTSSQVGGYTGPAGELVLNTDNGALYIQDGVTAGGKFALAPVVTVPQGRLTLTSGSPVQIADNAAAATIYYSPYLGRWCPIYNGSLWLPVAFSETALALDATNTDTGYQASGSLYDVFAFLNAGAFAIGTGPSWTSTTARGTGAGTTELQQLNGIWTNKNAIKLRFGSATGNTVSVPANQATYLGTMYATANGQTAMVFLPAQAAGGNGNVLGLWNAYNRVGVRARSADSTSLWVDGLGQSFATAIYEDTFGVNASGQIAYIGTSFDTIASPVFFVPSRDPNDNTPLITVDHTRAKLGLRFAQAVESQDASASTGWYRGAGYQLLSLQVEV